MWSFANNCYWSAVDAQYDDAQHNDVQNNDCQQEYVQNDVSHAQPDGIQVQESLRRSTRVSKAPGKFDDYVMLSDAGEHSSYNEAISFHH